MTPGGQNIRRGSDPIRTVFSLWIVAGQKRFAPRTELRLKARSGRMVNETDFARAGDAAGPAQATQYPPQKELT